MQSFDICRDIEKTSLDILRPFIEQRAYNGQYVVAEKGRLAREIQQRMGDVLLNTANGTIWTVELKAEQKNLYNNFFLETWSNRSRFTVGWLFTQRADFLIYHFIEDGIFYVISLPNLQKWAFHAGRLYAFPEKPQSKYEQLNDTWGRCVPIKILEQEIGCKCFRVEEIGG